MHFKQKEKWIKEEGERKRKIDRAQKRHCRQK
jgi:hypothetical protein